MNHERGYTLIEILIVVTIIAILAGVSTLRLGGLRRATLLESEISSISALVRTAQERSITQEQQSRWGIYIDNPAGSGGDTYSLFKVDEMLLASSTHFTVPGLVTDSRKIRNGLMLVTPEDGTSTSYIFNKLTGQTESGLIRLAYTSGPTASGPGVMIINKFGTITYPPVVPQ